MSGRNKAPESILIATEGRRATSPQTPQEPGLTRDSLSSQASSSQAMRKELEDACTLFLVSSSLLEPHRSCIIKRCHWVGLPFVIKKANEHEACFRLFWVYRLGSAVHPGNYAVASYADGPENLCSAPPLGPAGVDR